MSVAGLVLAAGEGRRFGRPKALVEFDGQRFVDRAVRLLLAGGCEPLVVVAGAVPLDVDDADVVYNDAWATGLGSSLRAGLESLGPEADAAVVALVDQPWVGPDAVRRLRAARRAGAVVAVATYAGRRGNPVLIGREVWAQVSELAVGDVGARAFMSAHPEQVTEVACDGTGHPDDVDRPADLPHD
ncbi:MAG TPA: nucleotidyltransferase family protein [Jiangellaceae bacterium]|nr:nucleotidyltransferase family protein [Jiangellaceae bacterium]